MSQNEKNPQVIESDIEYHLFSGKGLFDSAEFEIRNKTFEAWFKVWREVYEGQQHQIDILPDDFLRQDLISVITKGGAVMGMHMYSFFQLDCKASTSHHYFQFFNDIYWQKVKQRGVKSVMTMEYFTVLPEFRKAKVGHSLSKAISVLGTKLFAEVGVDAIIAPARNDLKVNKTAYDIGFSCIQENTLQRQFVCDLICCFQGDQHDSLTDPTANQMANELWRKRIVHGSARVLLSQFKDLQRKTAKKSA